MDSYSRLTRVNELLKREIAGIIEKNIDYSEGLLVSVTEVDTASDLRQAKVYISILGNQEEKEIVLQKLEEKRPFIQRTISKNITLKHTPVLTFYFEKRIKEGDRVLSIIEEIEKREK